MEDSKKVKKPLTIEDLIQFCEKNKFTTFDSKDFGYQLSVQIPSTFEVDENSSTQGLLRIKIKVAHTGVNRNKSHISKENMEKAMPSLKNRPVLANIHQLDNGEWDFRAHDFDIVTDKDGNQQFVYLEKQVGSFTEDEPYLEYDAERDVYFVIAYAVIPEDYTMAADILRSKNGTKNSCELCINTMSYNAQEKYLDLQDFYFAASTLLGAKENGEEIGEGMEGSRADIFDFSKDNNSVMNYVKQDEQINSKLIDTLERLNTTLSEFNINKEMQQTQNFSNNEKEGGIRSVKLEELLSKYNKTVDELDFETEGLSDEELEAKFVEAFDNNSERDFFIFGHGKSTIGELELREIGLEPFPKHSLDFELIEQKDRIISSVKEIISVAIDEEMKPFTDSDSEINQVSTQYVQSLLHSIKRNILGKIDSL